jgi:hypothetical protein
MRELWQRKWVAAYLIIWVSRAAATRHIDTSLAVTYNLFISNFVFKLILFLPSHVRRFLVIMGF